MEDFVYSLLFYKKYLPNITVRMLEKIYALLPTEFKEGQYYNIYANRIKEYESIKTQQELEKQNSELLSKSLEVAFDKIAFYKKNKLHYERGGFYALPVVDKRIISENRSLFINSSLKKSFLYTNTGGTTGIPFEFIIHKHKTRAKEKAHFDWFWGKYGYKANDRVLVIRGKPLYKDRLFEYQPIGNKLILTCYHLHEANIEKVLNEIAKFKPNFIHAYPSSLKIFTLILVNLQILSPIGFKCLFLGSERLDFHDKCFFEKYYNCKVISWYGHTERLIHGGTCSYTSDFHFYDFYGKIELLDKNGEQICYPGERGRIIATGYDNFAMPLIRYDTEDFGTLSSEKQCKCGFTGTTIKNIEGRGSDYILMKDGSLLALTALFFGQHLNEFTKIFEYQVRQEKKGEITVVIVKMQSFKQNDAESLLSNLLIPVRGNLDIKLRFTDWIEKTHNGKQRIFVQDQKIGSIITSLIKIME